jgi:hypothetical protein
MLQKSLKSPNTKNFAKIELRKTLEYELFETVQQPSQSPRALSTIKYLRSKSNSNCVILF